MIYEKFMNIFMKIKKENKYSKFRKFLFIIQFSIFNPTTFQTPLFQPLHLSSLLLLLLFLLLLLSILRSSTLPCQRTVTLTRRTNPLSTPTSFFLPFYPMYVQPAVSENHNPNPTH
jgi:hypothetical protein